MAADRIYTAQMRMTADISEAKTQLENLQSSINSLLKSSATASSSPGQKLKADFQDALNTVNQLKATLKESTNINTGNLDILKFSQSLNKTGMSLSKYAQQLSALGPAGKQVFADLAQSVSMAEIPLKKTNTLMQNFATTMKNTIKWQLSSSILHGFMGALQTSYGYAQDLNASLNDIRIVSGQSTEQMAKFAIEANKAAKALSSTTNDYAKASLIYYQQGLNDAQVKARTDITTKMANVTKESAQQVSDYMTAVWNNFDNGSKSLEYYADVMTALGAATASSTDEIATGLEKFAAVAETVGLSYEYATSALATITAETRQNADIVGNALKTLFSRIQGLNLGETLDDGTTLNKYSQALDKIGIDIKDANGEIKDMDVILNELGNKWGTLSKDTQIATAQTVAGVRQYTQLIALMDNWSTFQENLNTALTSTGELDRQAEIYAESWEASSKRVRAAAEGIWDSVMDEDFFIGVNNTLEDTLNIVEKLIDALGGMPGIIALIGSGMFKYFGPSMTNEISRLLNNLPLMTGGAQKTAVKLRREAATELANFDGASMTTSDALNLEYLQYASGKRNQWYEDLNSGKITKDQYNYLNAGLSSYRTLNQEAMNIENQLNANIESQAALLKRNGIKSEEQYLQDGRQSFLKAAFQRKYAEGKGVSNEAYFNMAKSNKNLLQGNELQAFKDANKAIKEINASTDDNATKTQKLNNVYSTFRNTIKKSGKDIKTYDQYLQGVSDSSQKNQKAVQDYQKLLKREKELKNNKYSLQENMVSARESLDNKDYENLGVDSIQAFAEGTTQVLQGSMRLGIGLSSIKAAIQTLQNEDLSFFDKFTSVLTSTGFAIPSIINGIESFSHGIQNLGMAFKTGLIPQLLASNLGIEVHNAADAKALIVSTQLAGAKIVLGKTTYDLSNKQDLENAAKAMGIDVTNELTEAELRLAMAKKMAENKDGRFDELLNQGKKDAFKSFSLGTIKILAVVAAVAALVAVVKQIQEQSPEGQLKKAKEQAENLAATLEDVKAKAEDLKNTIAGYDSAVKKLEDCTKGTQEWKEALVEANDAALELLDKYPQLYTTKNAEGNIINNVKRDNNGLITFIDEEATQKAIKDAENAISNLEYGLATSNYDVAEKQYLTDRNEFINKKLNLSNTDNYITYFDEDDYASISRDELANEYRKLIKNWISNNIENLSSLDENELLEQVKKQNKNINEYLHEYLSKDGKYLNFSNIVSSSAAENIVKQLIDNRENMQSFSQEYQNSSGVAKLAQEQALIKKFGETVNDVTGELQLVNNLIESRSNEIFNSNDLIKNASNSKKRAKELFTEEYAEILGLQSKDYEFNRKTTKDKIIIDIQNGDQVIQQEYLVSAMQEAVAAAMAMEEYSNGDLVDIQSLLNNQQATGLLSYIANDNFSGANKKDLKQLFGETSIKEGNEENLKNNLSENLTAIFGELNPENNPILKTVLDEAGVATVDEYLNILVDEVIANEEGITDIWKDSLIQITNSPLEEMSSDLQSQIADTLNEAFKNGGYEASNALTKILEDAAKISPDVLIDVLELINTFDFKNGDYQDFVILLREIMGAGYDASGAVEIFGQKMEEAGNRIPIDQLSTFIDKLKELLSLLDKTKIGDIVSDETIAKLEEYGLKIQDYAVATIDGWKLTKEIPTDAIENNLSTTMQNSQDIYNKLNGRTYSGGKLDFKTASALEVAQQTLAENNNNLSRNTINELTKNLTLEEKQALFANVGDADYISEILRETAYDSTGGGVTKDIDAQGTTDDYTRMLNAIIDTINQGNGGMFEQTTFDTMMLNRQDSLAQASMMQEYQGDARKGAILNFATGEKYADALKDYNDEIERLGTDVGPDAEKALDTLEKRIKNIDANEAAQSIGKLTEELKDIPKDSEEFNSSIGQISKDLANVFGKEFSDEVIKNNLTSIEQWSKGLLESDDLFAELQESEIKLKTTLDYDTVLEAFNQLNEQQKEIILSVRGEADLTSLAQQLIATGASAGQVAAILAAIGETNLNTEGFAELMSALELMARGINLMNDPLTLHEGAAYLSQAKEQLTSLGFHGLVPGDVDPNMEQVNGGGGFGSVTNPYSPSGGGGGSSGSDKTGKEQLQEKQMEVYEKKRDLLSTKRENMNPEDASKYIKEEIALLEKEQKILEKQIKSWKVLMKEKVEEFNAKYPEFEIKLTDDGEIANLADIYAAMEAKYDEIEREYGSAQAEEWHNEMMEALDLPVGLQENIDENVALIAQKEKEQAELALEEITNRIDWRIKQIDFEIKKLNYYQEKLLIQAHGNKQTIEAMLAGFQYQEQEMLQLFEKGAALRQGIAELKAAKAQYPGNEQIFDEAILDYQSDLVDLNLDILKLRQEMEELVQNVLDLALDEMDIQNERIEKYVSMLDHFQNIIDLSGRSMLDQELKVQIGATKVETLIDKMGIAKQKMEGLMEATKLAEEALAKRKADGDTTSVKFWENQVEVLKRELEAASEEFLGTWEDALTAASELFEMRVELAVQTLSDALSPFSSLEILQDRYNKEKEIQDQYLDDATRLYELNKLNREINQSIMDENDLLARSKLRDIQEEILALQKAGVEMSQYDLDVLQKKYDLRLAEIALMEAQNSKTSMRLIRDAAGNWTYAYDADEQAIEDATQKYEDAVYALDQLAKEYVNDVSNQLIEIQIEYKEALGEVDRNASDYQEQLLALQEHYMERYRYMLDELKKGADDQGLAFHETLYGQMMDLATYEDAYNQFVNNSDVTITELMTNYKDWQKVVEQAMNVAGTSWEDFGTDMDGTLMSLEEHIQALCDEISELVDVLMGYVAEAIGMVEEWQAKYSKRVDQELAANEAAFGSGLGGGGSYTFDMNMDFSKEMARYVREGGSTSDEYYQALVQGREQKIAQGGWGDSNASPGSTVATTDFITVSLEEGTHTGGNWTKHAQNSSDPNKNTITITVAKGDTGMYTGDWPIGEGMDEKGGKLALLHRKELVLNQTDTANILDAVNRLRSFYNSGKLNELSLEDMATRFKDFIETFDYDREQIVRSIESFLSQFGFGNFNLNKVSQQIEDKISSMLDWSNHKYSSLVNQVKLPTYSTMPIEQKVEIMAEFPGVTDQYQIQEALSNLSNDASQYLNIKRNLY